MKEDREPKTKFTPPPFFTVKYVNCTTYLYGIIHEHETLNVNKVNSEETPVALNPYGLSKRN